MSAPAVENKGVPELKSVQRIAAIPVVADSMNYAYSLTQSTAITAKMYATGNGLVTAVYGGVEPVLGYGRPIIETADGLANKTMDSVESRFPYIFKTPTGQVYDDYLKKPTDQVYGVAQGVYDKRVAPLHLDQNVIIHKAMETSQLLLEQLKKVQEGAVDATYKGVNGVQATSKELMDQLNKLTTTGATQVNDMFKNVSHDFTELYKKDIPTGDKAKEMIQYLVNSVTPILETAKDYVFTAKQKTEEKAGEAKEKAGEKADELK